MLYNTVLVLPYIDNLMSILIWVLREQRRHSVCFKLFKFAKLCFMIKVMDYFGKYLIFREMFILLLLAVVQYVTVILLVDLCYPMYLWFLHWPTEQLVSSMFSSLQVFVIFPAFFLHLISSFISLWLKKVLILILIFLNLFRLCFVS